MSDRLSAQGRSVKDLDAYLPPALVGHVLLQEALTHVSVGSRSNNERLEFLGDAVLGMAVADWLYCHRPQENEGGLSRLRASLVSRQALAGVANEVGLAEWLHVSEQSANSTLAVNERLLASAVEAVIGAVYRVEGWDSAVAFVERLLGNRLATLPRDAEAVKDAKTRLQERLQARGLALPAYRVARPPRHNDDQFLVVCVAAGRAACGRGGSRRAAEQASAEALLAQMHSRA